MHTSTRLGHLTWVPPSVDGAGTASGVLLSAFQRFFAVKLFCTFQSLWPWHAAGGGWVHAVAALSTVAMCWAPAARAGVCAWLGLMLLQVGRTWPYTLNHFVLEALILFVLSVFPLRLDATGRQAAPALGLLWLTLLSVWFFAGVQKVFQGYYLNGESIALAVTASSGSLGEKLRGGLDLLHALLSTQPSAAFPVPLALASLALNGVERWYCIGLGWLIPTGELLLPILCLLSRTQVVALWLLAGGQLGIGWLSGELDFALTALGLIGLGATRHGEARYAVLAAAAVLLA